MLKFREYFLKLSHKEVVKILSNYASDNVVKLIMDEKIVDPRELCFTIMWLEEKYYEVLGKPIIDAVFDPEEGFQLLEIIFPHGDWEKWKKVSREVKNLINRLGLKDIASKVAIVCLEALQEPRH